METGKNRFEEQDAPQKNTDKAFVKVGEDGKPQMPEHEKDSIKATQTPPVEEDEKEQ